MELILIRLEPTYGAGFNQIGVYIWNGFNQTGAYIWSWI